jgi:hypothetical protein
MEITPSLCRLALPLVCAALLAAGCATAPGSARRADPVATVAVVVNLETSRASDHAPDFLYVQIRPDLERQFAACVGRALAQQQLPMKAIDAGAMNQVAFPGIHARQAPRSIEALTLLWDNAEFLRRLDGAGIRYIAVIGGQTRVSDTQGGIGCAGGGAGAACLGTVHWDNETGLSATVIDLLARRQAGSAAVQASDTAIFGMALWFPFGKPSFVHEIACPRIGAAVATALATLRGHSP